MFMMGSDASTDTDVGTHKRCNRFRHIFTGDGFVNHGRRHAFLRQHDFFNQANNTAAKITPSLLMLRSSPKGDSETTRRCQCPHRLHHQSMRESDKMAIGTTLADTSPSTYGQVPATTTTVLPIGYGMRYTREISQRTT